MLRFAGPTDSGGVFETDEFAPNHPQLGKRAKHGGGGVFNRNYFDQVQKMERGRRHKPLQGEIDQRYKRNVQFLPQQEANGRSARSGLALNPGVDAAISDWPPDTTEDKPVRGGEVEQTHYGRNQQYSESDGGPEPSPVMTNPYRGSGRMQKGGLAFKRKKESLDAQGGKKKGRKVVQVKPRFGEILTGDIMKSRGANY